MSNDLEILFGCAFNPATVEPQADFEVLPPGKYLVLIEAARVRQTKAGTGHYIELTLSVMDGDHKNRKLWDRINVQNPSAQCVEIGLRTLSALGRALGLQAITDTTQLVNQVVIAHAKVKNEQNYVRTYSPATEAAAAPAQQQASAAPSGPQMLLDPATSAPSQAPTKETSKPPWAK